MSTFTVVLAELEQERSRLNNQLAVVSNALAVLNGSKSNGPARSRTLSPAARARIAAAQRARWALLGNRTGADDLVFRQAP